MLEGFLKWVLEEPHNKKSSSLLDGSDDSDDDKYEGADVPEIPKGEYPTGVIVDEHGKVRKKPINFESKF